MIPRPRDEWGATALWHLSATGVPERLAATDALVLERLARGGGATKWFYCQDLSALASVAARLSPGSEVRFIFDDRFERPPAAKLADVARPIMLATREVLIGVLAADGIQIEMNMLGDEDELAVIVNGLPANARLFVGVYPGADDDGAAAVTTQLPDSDGMVRGHPH